MKPEYIERMVMTHLATPIQTQLKEERNKEAYCPFVFKGKRQYPFHSLKKENLKYPPPGQYQIKSSFDNNQSDALMFLNKKGMYQKNQSPIFKSKIMRFKQNIIEGPAPTSYENMTSEFCKRKQKHKSLKFKKRNVATEMTARNMNQTDDLLSYNRGQKKNFELENFLQNSTKQGGSLIQANSLSQNPLRNKLLSQKKIKINTKFHKSWNFNYKKNSKKEIENLKKTMNTLIEPKTVSNSFNIKSKQKIIKTFKKVDKSNKKRKDIYINEEKIEQIKEENKKYKQIGPGWYESQSAFHNEQNRENPKVFEFFQSSSVRFYEQTPQYDERYQYYEDPFHKYKKIPHKKCLKVGITVNKINKGQTKEENFKSLRFSVDKTKTKQNSNHRSRGQRSSCKNKLQICKKENKQVKASINKFNDYYQQKMQSKDEVIGKALKLKYYRIT